MPQSEFWPFTNTQPEKNNGIDCGETSVLVSSLREELIKTKNIADEERFQREKYENKLKDLEEKLNGFCCTGQIATPNLKGGQASDNEVMKMKTQIKDLKDELEETRLTLNEKTDELQEYRLKYLQAQQQVEELRRQLEVVDFDNKQVSEQVQIEIQKMKMLFQEKLHELSPLPDLLKGAQMELQEAKQLQRLAEDNAQQLSSELHRVKEKLVIAVTCLNKEKAEKTQAIQNNKILRESLDEKQKECGQLTTSVDDYKCAVLRLQEKLTQQQDLYKEKSLECVERAKDLEEIRQEMNKSLMRQKERGESVRKYFQAQVGELERQLVQSRAQCRTLQKERDDVRQHMQMQVNSLKESFEMAEIRLRTLLGQMTGLRNNFEVILSSEDENVAFIKA